LGVQPRQLDCNRDVEHFVFAFFRLVFPMRVQTTTQDAGKAHERPTIADRAFVTLAITDDFTIKAENRVPEWKAICIWSFLS
jgi:hypothetical protein